MVPNLEQLNCDMLQPSPEAVDETSNGTCRELRMTHKQFLAFLRMFVDKWGQQAAMARKWGISKEELCRVINNRQEPGPKLLKAVHARRETVYVVTVETENNGNND